MTRCSNCRLKRFLVGVWFVVGGTGTLAIQPRYFPEPERARLWAQDHLSPVAFRHQSLRVIDQLPRRTL
jgi:hypothetical protein